MTDNRYNPPKRKYDFIDFNTDPHPVPVCKEGRVKWNPDYPALEVCSSLIVRETTIMKRLLAGGIEL
jgi:hypothetical protein